MQTTKRKIVVMMTIENIQGREILLNLIRFSSTFDDSSEQIVSFSNYVNRKFSIAVS